jgi:hypothetical protein
VDFKFYQTSNGQGFLYFDKECQQENTQAWNGGAFPY